MIKNILSFIKKFSMLIIKILGILVVIILILIIFLFISSSNLPSVPSDYTEKVETGGEIEHKYLTTGDYEISYREEEYSGAIEKFVIYYPTELEMKQNIYPVVLMINGTGVPAYKYKPVFEHLASWGFIVIGNNDPSTGSGESADIMVNYILGEHNNKNSLFYGKIDVDNIGIEGHSQGGAGVLSAVSIQKTKDIYKTAVSLSPTNEEMAHNLGWPYDLGKINIPTLIFAGTTGDFETKLVIPFEKMNEMYNKLNCSKVMARKTGLEHGNMLYSADGYATAWLMCYLKGDKEACKGFQGDNPEILNNKLYQDQRIDFNSINFN